MMDLYKLMTISSFLVVGGCEAMLMGADGQHREPLKKTAELQVQAFLEKNPVEDIPSLVAAINETYHRDSFTKSCGVTYRQYRDRLATSLLCICKTQTVVTPDLEKCIFVLSRILGYDDLKTKSYQASDFKTLGIDSLTLSSVDIW